MCPNYTICMFCQLFHRIKCNYNFFIQIFEMFRRIPKCLDAFQLYGIVDLALKTPSARQSFFF